MGNNRLELKMFVSSAIWLIVVYFLVNIFEFGQNTVTILLGSAFIFIFISGIYWSYEFYTPKLFREYDEKYNLKYGEKLILSKNDKYILKQICYTIHNGTYHKSVITAILTSNVTEIDNFLLRNKWEVNDRHTFNNVMCLISEYLSSKI